MHRFYYHKGRVALYAIMQAMGIGPGDDVILPGFTCVVVPNAVSWLGARPVYVDIDPETFNINPAMIEEKINDNTRAIITQHSFGMPAEMGAIAGIAERHGIHVIEDCCHAIGSGYHGKLVGTFGAAAFFSSQWSKPVTTALGGWADVNDPELAARMRAGYGEYANVEARESASLKLQYIMHKRFFKPSLFWLAQGLYRRLTRLNIVTGSSSNEELECRMPDGFRKRMSGWQIKELERKLAHNNEFDSHRKRVAARYELMFRELGKPVIQLPTGCDPVFLRYPVLVKNKQKVLDMAKSQRLEIGDWFVSPLHPNMSGWERAGYHAGDCPVSEHVCRHIVNLPTHSQTGEREIERIVRLVADEIMPAAEPAGDFTT